MMRVHLWRLLLILSLLLTLPMQGYAAARMASCDAVLAGALASASAGVLAGAPIGVSSQGHTSDAQGAPQHGVHDITATMMQNAPHDLSHGGALHPIAAADGSPHGDMPAGKHGGSHDSHGSSCMSCSPCSPGATLTCVVPVTSTFLSARVLPAQLVAPTSADLAHPERPPQAFLA